jgi:PAS domain S-box-containing protein
MVDDRLLQGNCEEKTGKPPESERKYHSLLENIPDITWTTDQTGRTVFISPNVTRVYGYSPEEIYEASDILWFGRIHPDDLPHVQEAFDALFTGNRPFDVEYRIQRKDGNWIWLHDRSISTYEKDGVRYADGLFSDITERKESEERYRMMFESMGDGVAIYEAVGDGQDFIFRGFNRAGETIERVKREDVIGKSVLQAFPGVREFGLFDVFQRVWKTGKPEHFPAGLYKDHRITGWRDNYVYKLPSGEVVAIYRDVTERKRVEEKLRGSVSLLRAALESTADGILVVDREGKVTSFNRRFAELWRIPESILRNKDSLKLREFVADQLEDPKKFLATTKALYDEPERII